MQYYPFFQPSSYLPNQYYPLQQSNSSLIYCLPPVQNINYSYHITTLDQYKISETINKEDIFLKDFENSLGASKSNLAVNLFKDGLKISNISSSSNGINGVYSSNLSMLTKQQIESEFKKLYEFCSDKFQNNPNQDYIFNMINKSKLAVNNIKYKYDQSKEILRKEREREEREEIYEIIKTHQFFSPGFFLKKSLDSKEYKTISDELPEDELLEFKPPNIQDPNLRTVKFPNHNASLKSTDPLVIQTLRIHRDRSSAPDRNTQEYKLETPATSPSSKSSINIANSFNFEIQDENQKKLLIDYVDQLLEKNMVQLFDGDTLKLNDNEKKVLEIFSESLKNGFNFDPLTQPKTTNEAFKKLRIHCCMDKELDDNKRNVLKVIEKHIDATTPKRALG